MTCKTYPLNELKTYKYVVTLSQHKGEILLSRHKDRTTWETQGGHIEPGETPLAAAKRELYEESGATEYDITPLFDYRAGEENGMVFAADIRNLAPIPNSEMAEIKTFSELPENLTYPDITPILFAQWKEMSRIGTKKLLYGTGNPAKLAAMRSHLADLGIELIGLSELGKKIPEVTEDGHTPLENARKKALAYYREFQMPVFSCDSGLYIEGLPDDLQPGVHVRTVNGKYLTDDEMIEHYSNLAGTYGALRARYRNAICLVLHEACVYEAMEKSMESEEFLITAKPHPMRREGFPLDSLSLDLKTGKYYYDLESERLETIAVEDGFLEFFRRLL